MANKFLTTLLIIALAGFITLGFFYWQMRGELISQTQEVENLLKQIDTLEKQIKELRKVSLPVPNAPSLSYVEGISPFVQIIWDYDIADYFNIYRATNPDGPWVKINTELYPQNAHSATDYNYPKEINTLYYRITSADEVGHESEPSGTSSVKLTPDDTATWKTYRNEEYGFEVKYPRNWTMTEGLPVTEAPRGEMVLFSSGDKKLEIQINSERKTEHYTSLENFASDYPTPKDKLEIKSQERVILNEVSGIRQITEISDPDLKGGIHTYIEGSNYVYVVITREGKSAQNIYDQMLSTFRFLE